MENFLLLTAEISGARKAKFHNFMKFWEIIEKSTKNELIEKISMERLNRTRNNLKHSGIIPNAFHVQEFKESVTKFFEGNTKTIFNLNFEEIDPEKHTTEIMVPQESTMLIPEIEEIEKTRLRKIYSSFSIIPKQASRTVYEDYILKALLTSIIASIILLLPLTLFKTSFNETKWIFWAIFAPVITTVGIIDPSNAIIQSYTNIFVDDIWGTIWIIGVTFTYVVVFVIVFSLSFEEEKYNKQYFSNLLREILELNKYIGIKDLSRNMNVTEEVLDVWLSLIHPKFNIKKEDRYIRTVQRSISNSELEDLMNWLYEAQDEVDYLEKKEKNR